MIHLHEALLEPLFRYLRFHVAEANLPKEVGICVDLGCGPQIRLFHFMKARGVKIHQYWGFDPLIAPEVLETYVHDPTVKLFTKESADIRTIESNTIDVVTGFAFLEHIDDPKGMLSEVVRILKPGGKALFTTPTHKAKPLLEFLAFRLHIVSAREIAEHKNYFSREDILALLPDHGENPISLHHRYFELGCNNYFMFTK